MWNERLQKQLQKYSKTLQTENVAFENFLQEISETYDQLENTITSGAPMSDKAGAIKKLNVRLTHEAEELKKAHTELGRILNSVNHGFFSRDLITDGYIYLSQACEKIYGYKIDEFFNNKKLWYEVIYREDRFVVERDNERLKNKEEVYTQYRIIHKEGIIKWIESTLIPFFKDGLLVRVDGVVNEITKRKEEETERDVIMKELIAINADLKQFSYITSHNLRSPLSNIQGILNLFDFDENDEHNSRLLQMLKTTSQQLHTTIEDLTQILIIKNNVNPDPSDLNLEDIFHHVLKTYTNSINEVGGTVVTDFKSPCVKLKKVFLESIFINLISNAVKYHSPQRRLLIQVESTQEEDNYVCIKFIDNGIGIDLNRHKGKVFGLYQRFHDNIEGKGLGLFIIKSQIESTGGTIVIESEPGTGTTFFIRLKR
jgi:PAS domain S-box-containing protein